ncbi:MAG: hypothetical protein JWL95_173 [Gemmatimonadetes bacterium]|nr:hypothetical protein [Gemmatimonadota bacterium]
MSNSRNEVATAPASRDARSRSYVDGDGQCWQVSEQPFSQFDRRSGYSLIFASDLAVRRVRNYPADWETLSDLALAALSWGV